MLLTYESSFVPIYFVPFALFPFTLHRFIFAVARSFWWSVGPSRCLIRASPRCLSIPHDGLMWGRRWFDAQISCLDATRLQDGSIWVRRFARGCRYYFRALLALHAAFCNGYPRGVLGWCGAGVRSWGRDPAGTHATLGLVLTMISRLWRARTVDLFFPALSDPDRRSVFPIM